MERKPTCRSVRRALVATALAMFATGAIAGDATFFSHRDFTGQAMTVRGPAAKLEQIGFNDTASSVVIRQGVWEVCTEAHFRGRCKELQPGEYSSFGVGPSDRIASAREIGAQAQPLAISPSPPAAASVPPLPPASPPLVGLPLITGATDGPRIVLYENGAFRGRSVELNRSVDDLDRMQFGDRADSAIVLNGVWRLCEIRGGRGDCIEIGPGRYDTLGALTNRIGSAEILAGEAAVPAPRSEGRAVLYRQAGFRGQSIVVDRADVPRLAALPFGDSVGSLQVESGQWMFCSGESYQGACRTFGPGHYARLPLELDHVRSGRQVEQRYSQAR